MRDRVNRDRSTVPSFPPMGSILGNNLNKRNLMYAKMGPHCLFPSLLRSSRTCACVCHRFFPLLSPLRTHSSSGKKDEFVSFEMKPGQSHPSSTSSSVLRQREHTSWIYFRTLCNASSDSGRRNQACAVRQVQSRPFCSYGSADISQTLCKGTSSVYLSTSLGGLRGLPSSFLVPQLGLSSHGPVRHSSTEATTAYEALLNSQAVHFAEGVFQYVHSLTGLPWWASIIATTVSLRLALTLPLAIYSQNIRARVENLQPEVVSLARRAFVQRFAPRAKNEKWSEKRAQRAFVGLVRHYSKELYVRDNCHPAKGSILFLVQLPMWIFLSLALRNMTGAFSDRMFVDPASIVPDLAAGGALWFPSLAAPDPTLILPVLVGVLNLANIEMHALHRGRVTRVQRALNNTLRTVSVIMVPVAAYVPAAMALYWATSACYGLGQNILLKAPTTRRALGIRPCKADSETPFRDMGQEFVERYVRRSQGKKAKETILEELKDDDSGEGRTSREKSKL